MAVGSGGRGRRLWLINGAIVLVLLLAVGATVVALRMSGRNPNAGVRTTPIGHGTVTEAVTATGSVTSAVSSTVNFDVSGKIAKILVKRGDRVHKGQVLAGLDGDFARQNLAATQARVDADESQLAAARKRVTANEQALDAAEAAADVPIDQRSGATGAMSGSPGQPATPGQGSMGTGGTTGTGTGTGIGTGPAQQAAAPAQPAPARPGPAQPAPAQPAPAQPAPAQPAPAPIPVEPPWWCFWCEVTYVYPPPPAAPPAPMTPPPMTPPPVPTTMPAAGAATGTGQPSQGAQATQPQGPSPKQKEATKEQDDANVKAAKATLAESKATLAGNEATLAQDKANRITAQQGNENLELVAPQDGTVVSLDGQVGQNVGPQGVVASSTGSGNPAGGTLPNGSAVSSGAGSGSSSGSSSGSGSSGGSTNSSGSSGGSNSSSGSGSSGGTSGGSSSSGNTVTGAPSAPAVLSLADLGGMQIKAEVPELDVGRVAAGQPVNVQVNAMPGQTVPGRVALVDDLPGSGSAVQYGTMIDLANPPPGMRLGMSASVSITTRTAPNATFLPSVAIRSSGEGAKTGTVDVLTGPDQRRETRTIGLGLSSDTVTQVTSGLADGELVVLPEPTPSTTSNNGGGGGRGGGGNGGGGGGGGR